MLARVVPQQFSRPGPTASLAANRCAPQQANLPTRTRLRAPHGERKIRLTPPLLRNVLHVARSWTRLRFTAKRAGRRSTINKSPLNHPRFCAQHAIATAPSVHVCVECAGPTLFTLPRPWSTCRFHLFPLSRNPRRSVISISVLRPWRPRPYCIRFPTSTRKQSQPKQASCPEPPARDPSSKLPLGKCKWAGPLGRWRKLRLTNLEPHLESLHMKPRL